MVAIKQVGHEVETVKRLNINKSYFIKDTIKGFSKRGKDFQESIDVHRNY